MKRALVLAVVFIFSALQLSVFAQFDPTATWTNSVEVNGDKATITFTGKINKGLHTYSVDSEISATEIEVTIAEGCHVDGKLREGSETKLEDGMLVVYDKMTIYMDVVLDDPSAKVEGVLTWMCCDDHSCLAPEDYEFSIKLGEGAEEAAAESFDVDEAHQTPLSDPEDDSDNSGLWALILEAILWGFAMLLTPCVFPMVPMTISFFIKGSATKAQGRFKAMMYGLFIVLLYTLPITAIIALTRLIGGDAVTADIFNWLATHWLPNIVFFVVFMIFAASFFGAFEITLPSSIVNKSDEKSDKAGLAGIFFMALTLVLVSFSCTGPIVGSVLIKSTQGEFWTPMVTMLAFSIAFALPFTVLALFPSLLKNLPKSGGWLNSVKVVLGFIEIALGFKFLSTADQTYHWGLLDREVYLAIWIATFSLLGLYLLGKLKFKHDDDLKYLSVGRLGLAIGVFSFVVYLIPGMWGAPLKALSGYLPPMETQDFIVLNSESTVSVNAGSSSGTAMLSGETDLDMPHGLRGYSTIEAALVAAKEQGKPVFVDITGHGCVNCREMEARVWSDPKVLEIMKNDYVMCALYCDDKTKLDEKDWVTTDTGKVLKDVGRVNSYIARTRVNVNAQPHYALIDENGDLLITVRG
ncbi:MAG: thioredoxin family protein [Bacteroidales bacterium]|nr:thioredoxin family protein [Bacteroidales bacterium]